MKFQKLFLGAFLALSIPAGPVSGAPGGDKICERAARLAADRTGVPFDVLMAISLTETGRKSGGTIRPWPWTVNMEGKGIWFATFGEALDFTGRNFDRGARSFDVGCFQLNYKWHGRSFSSVREMFDPTKNALYAANFLRELFAETGNWIDAAGAYHSRTPKYAERYKRRFRTLLASQAASARDATDLVTSISPEHKPRRVGPRANSFPLLLGGDTVPASLGSLMPMAAGSNRNRFIGEG